MEVRVLAAVVERRHRRDEGVAATGGDDAEIVADERARRAYATGMQGRQLRIPAVLRQPDIVSDRRQVGLVELDRGVDAVVRATPRRAGRSGGARIEGDARACPVGIALGRAS